MREGTTVISPPRGGPRDHGRGNPCPSHIRLWLDLETDWRRNQGEKNAAKHGRRREDGEEIQEMAKFGAISGRQTGCKSVSFSNLPKKVRSEGKMLYTDLIFELTVS